MGGRVQEKIMKTKKLTSFEMKYLIEKEYKIMNLHFL